MKSFDRKTHRDIARRFGAAATRYDGHADIQRHAAERLLTFADDLTPRSVLDLGCGTGLLSELMHARWPTAEFVGLDIAPPMLARYRARMAGANARAYAADIACLARNPVFDLVATNCALHWIDPLSLAAEHLAAQMRPGGTALISIMLDGTLAELHAARAEAAPDVPTIGRLPSLQALHEALNRAGLTIRASEEERIQKVLPSAKTVLDAVRGQGVTGGHLARGVRPLKRSELARLETIYTERFATEDGVAMSWRIGYARAEKP